MPRKSHPFAASPGRPKAVQPVKPMKSAIGEMQGLAPTDNFKSTMPAVPQYNKGGMVKHHDDPTFCTGGSSKRR